MDNESNSYSEEQQVPSPAGMGEEVAADSAQERLFAGLGVRAATVESQGSSTEDASDGGLLHQIKLLQGQLAVSRALRDAEKDEHLGKLREAYEIAAANKRSASLAQQRLAKLIEDHQKRERLDKEFSNMLIESALAAVRAEKLRMDRRMMIWRELALRGDVAAAQLHDAEDSVM